MTVRFTDKCDIARLVGTVRNDLPPAIIKDLIEKEMAVEVEEVEATIVEETKEKTTTKRGNPNWGKK